MVALSRQREPLGDEFRHRCEVRHLLDELGERSLPTDYRRHVTPWPGRHGLVEVLEVPLDDVFVPTWHGFERPHALVSRSPVEHGHGMTRTNRRILGKIEGGSRVLGAQALLFQVFSLLHALSKGAFFPRFLLPFERLDFELELRLFLTDDRFLDRNGDETGNVSVARPSFNERETRRIR